MVDLAAVVLPQESEVLFGKDALTMLQSPLMTMLFSLYMLFVLHIFAWTRFGKNCLITRLTKSGMPTVGGVALYPTNLR
jgi:hypothetical protein